MTVMYRSRQSYTSRVIDKKRKKSYDVYRKRTARKAIRPTSDLPTVDDLPALDELQAQAILCKNSFYDFVKAYWHTVIQEPPIWNWHIEYICKQLQKMAERIFKRLDKDYDLVINVPPGSSKSTIASVMFPAWCWARMPACRILGASYGEDLALDLANKCRDVIKSDLYKSMFPYVKLRKDGDNKSALQNTMGGTRHAVGSGSTPIGKHYDIILIDDPIDPDAALSEVEMKAINRWITSTLNQRKTSQARTPMILIMQRLHEEDPSAQMLRKRRIFHIRIPATNEYEISPPDLESHYSDGLMDPIRLPRHILEEKQRPEELGDYGFAGQYGQNPIPLGGGKFNTDMLILNQLPPKQFKSTIRYWDKAVSKKKRAAYTVGVLLGLAKDDSIWVLDVVRGRWSTWEREDIIVKTSRLDATRFGGTIKDYENFYEKTKEIEEYVPDESTKRRMKLMQGKKALGDNITEQQRNTIHRIMSPNVDEDTQQNTDISIGKNTHIPGKPLHAPAVHTSTRGYSDNRTRKFITNKLKTDYMIGLEEEGGSGGAHSAADTVRRLMGFVVKVDKASHEDAKEVRADPFSVQVNMGNVYIAPGKWNDEYIQEMKHFPFSKTKDQIDASSGGFSHLSEPIRKSGGLPF